MKIVHYLAVCGMLLAAPALADTAPAVDIIAKNPAIKAIAEHHPDNARILIEELQALRDAEEEDFDGQNIHMPSLTDEDKETLQHNPFLMDVYEHNPHGMAELLKRIRNAGN